MIRREGAAARRWIEALPALAERFLTGWRLEPDGEPMHGFVGLVLPVTRADGAPAVLKLTWLDTETRDEPTALSTWDGAGAVLLLESDPSQGALLLERLDAGRTLNDRPIVEATEIAGELLRRLSVPAPAPIRRLRDEAARLTETLPATWARLGEPVPRRLVDTAVALCRELGPESGTMLVNEDLHYENVLAGTREPWLVIDPKPVAGDPEFAVIPLLWNRIDESTMEEKFAVVVGSAGLDRARAHAWTFVRAVQNWLWALESAEAMAPGLATITHWAARKVG
ncbi:aminoglycoside phosphotransferase family protein [Amycolatopsis taiwanensis]|uniref:aminoglycoside phosphotransferase family protein n=1 Tax=Amycolatopsis taiwanensis TaxID=342230 RepID=UPI0004898751|nr:aminoglycoside phosphotransferase family protein [Amycolatopsis taiwanensis]